ncbi:UNVERIFIED_CONTAM: hypothetical protein GTU68_023423 [Idotea baltica]|nr:hypothetical protein [Idotea baltica]
MNTVKIQKIGKADIELLQKLAIQTFVETYSSHNTAENMKNYIEESFATERLAKELENSASAFYLALENNIPLGYLKTEMKETSVKFNNEKSLAIERIYVLQEFQGKKIGQLLVQKAIEIANQEKLNYLWLGVWEKNQKAIKFYKKNGFIEFDKLTFKLGDEIQSDILMALKLS